MFNLFTKRKQEPGPLATGLKAYLENPGRKTAIGLLRGLKTEYDAAADADGKRVSPTIAQGTRKSPPPAAPTNSLA